MPIKTFRITNAGPFEDITFEFDEHVNVFVGPNNSGKSTALLALATATVFSFAFPTKLLHGPGREGKWEITLFESQLVQPVEGNLLIPLSPPPHYQATLDHLVEIGFSTFIPAIRNSTEFRPKGPEIHTPEVLVGQTPGGAEFSNLAEWERRSELTKTEASLIDDEAIIRKMIELDYAAYRRRNPEIRGLIDKVAKIASEITEGYPIDFLGVGEDRRGLFPEFQTPDGRLPLNVLSQGTQSTIQWLAHLVFGYAQYNDYPENLTEKPGVLIVDEIDAHLHPSWQRRIIPALTKNFPNLQIFCSTHSPLMLAGLEEGQVQLLNRDADGRVTVSRNRWDMAGWSTEEILRSVLGLTDTIDLATASEIDRMGELSIKETLSDGEATELEEIRSRVEQGLLDGPPSSQVESFRQFVRQVYSKQASGSESSGRPRPRVRRRENGSS